MNDSLRKVRDSNPGYLAVRLISSQVHSTTLPTFLKWRWRKLPLWEHPSMFFLIKNSVSAQPYSVCRTQGYYVFLNLPSSLCRFIPPTLYFNVRLLTTKLCSPVHPIGVEPITLALEGRCSIQLSYGCIQYVGEELPTDWSRLFILICVY